METLQPKLRFSEFNGNWDEETLGSLGKVSMCKRILKEQTTNEGEIPFYKIGTFGKEADAFINKEIYEDFKLKYSFPSIGDILISASGTIGRTVVYDGKPAYFQDSNIVWIANKEEKVLNNFLLFLYENTKWNTENTTIARLYNDNLRNIIINVPTIKEQTKIANFLSAIDEKLNLLKEKKETLEAYKKGIMQKIFNQEIRFKDDNGNDFEDWEDIELGEVLDYIQPTKYIVKSTDYDDNFETPVLTAGKTFILGYTNETFNIFSEKLPVIIFDDFTTANKFVDFPFKVKSSAMKILVCNNENVNIKYIYEFIQTLNFGTGDEHKRYWISEYSKCEIQLPHLKEQTKIADFLSAIDKKIELVNTQIEDTQEYKKGLLQQMFV